MTVVQSLGTLATLQVDWLPASWGWTRSTTGVVLDYPTLYRTQPNIRICVDFLARNVAQLGLHTYRRVSDTDRERLTDHALAELLDEPNPFQTRYRHIESTMVDMGVWGNAYWLKIRNERTGLKLLRLPPQYVGVTGGLVPTKYELTFLDKPKEFAPTEIVHFRLPNPASAIYGLSPIESLRDLLEEDGGLTDFRTRFWDNAARPGGIIERPLEAPEWSDEARRRFKATFQAAYAGAENAGNTLILEDGMHWVGQSQTAEESQAFEFRKLGREDVARAYHIPLPMVGILDHATFSNVREQHKQLYQDCLGPWLKMFEEDIELQLLPEFTDRRGVYVEFNIAEKLAGSFEEQTDALQTAIGRPWMTPDEGRARFNLPAMNGQADELGVPVNMVVGDAALSLPAGGEAA